MRPRLAALLLPLPFLATATVAPRRPAADTPRAAVEALLAADRGFAEGAGRADLVTGLGAAFAPDVAVLTPRGFADGRDAALAAFRADTLNARSTAQWTPLRGGVSADGAHGFTAGAMLVRRPDGATVPYKYLAYWVKRPEGWRVAVYKRVRVEQPMADTAAMPPAVPARLVAAVTDSAAIAAHRATLDRAERTFSDDAQRLGIGPAFARWGSADAINLGGPRTPGFVVGADAIGRLVGEGVPPNTSPVTWGPDRVLVASSGDLGVTLGQLVPNGPVEPGRPRSIPFITIWRRADPSQPWRYVAE